MRAAVLIPLFLTATTHAAIFPSVPLNPEFKPTVLTTSATLGPKDRYVAVNNAGGAAAITLETTPPDGTMHDVTQVSDTLQRVTITAGAGATIIDGTTASIILSGFGSKAVLQYHAGLTRWEVLNLQRQSYTFRLDSANANDYVQRGQITLLLLGTAPVLYVGGNLSSAAPFQTVSGTIVFSNLFLQSRSAVGAATTVKARLATNNFGSAADLANNLSATIANGASSAPVTSARTVVTAGPDTAIKSWVVIQATTAVGTPVDGVLEFYTL